MQAAPPEVASVIARWHSDMVPADAAAFTREVVARAAPASKARAKALLFAASRAASFACGVGPGTAARGGLLPGRHRALHRGQRAEVLGPHGPHVAHQLPGHRPGAGRLPRAGPGAPAPGTGQKALHGRRDLGLPGAGRRPARRWPGAMRAGAVICLGAGAGLVGAELSAVRGRDVACRSGGVVVDVAGRRPRAVPVLCRYQARLMTSAAFAGTGYLVGGTERSRRNVASALVALAVPGGPTWPAWSRPGCGPRGWPSWPGAIGPGGVHGRRRRRLLPAPGRHRAGSGALWPRPRP